MQRHTPNYTGHIESPRLHPYLWLEEVEGRIPLVIHDIHAGPVIGYFTHERRPKLGTRVAVVGETLTIRKPVPREEAPEGLPWSPDMRAVQWSYEVKHWVVVDEDYDELFDPMPEALRKKCA